jgi:hypothetical protein
MTSYKKEQRQLQPVLDKFLGNFFLKFYEFITTHEDAARLGLRGLSIQEKAELAPLLDELISARYSADDLVKLWEVSPAENQLSNGEQIRMLLKAARAKIG